MLITISNLFPRPDQPTRGMYNFRLFRELGKVSGMQNLCLVPEWRVWQWKAIRKWETPGERWDNRQRTTGKEKHVSPEAATNAKTESEFGTQESRKKGELWNTRYLPVFYIPFVGRSVNDLFYALALRPWAKRIRPGDVVYAAWLYPDGVAATRVFRRKGARVWLMALGSDTFHLQSLWRRKKLINACIEAEGIVCVANVLADRLAEAGVPRAKMHVVPNGVDTSVFRVRNQEELMVHGHSLFVDGVMGAHNHQCPITKNSPADGRTILFVGNLVPVKGPDIMLRAFATLRKTLDIRPQTSDHSLQPARHSSTVSLVIIGSGPMRKQLDRLTEALGIAARVHFLGCRPPEEVAQWMNVADVLCLTSRSEGMPNVVLEARASGLPVVTSPAGACPELPLDREGLHVVADFTPEAVAAGLERVLNERVIRNPDTAVPTWEHQAGKLLELIGKRMCGQ